MHLNLNSFFSQNAELIAFSNHWTVSALAKLIVPFEILTFARILPSGRRRK